GGVAAPGVVHHALARGRAEERGPVHLDAVRAILVGDRHRDVAGREHLVRPDRRAGLAGNPAALRDAFEARADGRWQRRDIAAASILGDVSQLARGRARPPFELGHRLVAHRYLTLEDLAGRDTGPTVGAP